MAVNLAAAHVRVDSSRNNTHAEADGYIARSNFTRSSPLATIRLPWLISTTLPMVPRAKIPSDTNHRQLLLIVLSSYHILSHLLNTRSMPRAPLTNAVEG